jgi:hypothetical protein
MARQEKGKSFERALAQDEKVMRSTFRAVFLSNENARNTLWFLLINQCNIFQRCENEEMRIRHNIGIDILEMCGLLRHGYRPHNLFIDLSRMRKLTKWQRFKNRFRRKR